MNTIKTALIALCISLALPSLASAHAIPVSMTPESSSVVDTVPARIAIHFSERIDPGASSVTIQSPEMTMQEPVRVDPSDPRTLSAPVMDGGNGTYLVSWSAVSADDGHFTKGAYAFAVGKGSVIAITAPSAEVVEIATTPEALSMTVELLGNGIIWAALILFAFAIRPLLLSGRFASEEEAIKRGYGWFLTSGAALAIIGGALQLWVKSGDLASLHGSTFLAALPVYIGTAAGFATAVRMVAVAVVVGIFLAGRKAIARARRITVYEIGMMLAMCVFAYFRAKISHAAANPFHPGFSITVNFLHLLEKDIWAGIVLALLILSVSRKYRDFLIALLPRAFALLAIDFALVSVTATYIVWLHLKSFANLFTTQWGTAFLQLFAAAVVLVALRTALVFARLWRPKTLLRVLPLSLGAEFAAALLVIYCSSVVIITSPPLSQPATPVFSATDQGVVIQLARDPYEDGMLMLTASRVSSAAPVLTIEDESGVAGPTSIDLSKRFDGGYAFPQSLLVGAGPFKAAITVTEYQGFDAHASFEFAKDAFTLAAGWEAHRALDFFTIVMILIALSALGYALFLYRFSRRSTEIPYAAWSEFSAFHALGAFLAVSLIVSWFVGAMGNSALVNPFKARCEGDGNMWHLMQPMKAGVALAQQSMEGCMWGMGSYLYMFPDQSEYAYESALPHAEVTLDHAPFAAGIPATFRVRLAEADGSPATLFTDMDKLIHVVIVSKDETVFAHIHPDDAHPLSKADIDSSSFTLDYTFPKSGEYLISVDYAHGLTLESKQFTVDVGGSPPQAASQKTYASSGVFGGYSVSLDYFQPFAGEVATLRYTISKNGTPVTDIVPYLEAAMHVSVVKNDFSAFLHVHGEVHPPGVPLPPIIIKNGQVVHSMAMMSLPTRIGPNIEAHLIFPSAGVYTVWGEFKVGNTVIPTSFSVRVE